MTIKATIKSSNGLQQQGEFDSPPFTGITGKINMDVPQPDGTIKNKTLDIPYINGRYDPPQYVVQVMKRADGSTYNVRVLVQASGSIDPPLKGWERRGDKYYYNGVQVNPQDYLYPDGDRPAYSICVGSQYYDAYYKQRWSDRWIAGGVNIADWNYVIPTQWTVASGNDIWTQVEGVDGRIYAAQLINRSINGAAGYMGTSPQLQYSDDNGRTWAQYFRPVDQTRFKDRGWITGPYGRVWTGNFHIFQSDATLAGRSFTRGEVLYSAVNVQHETNGQRMWGIDTGNKCACFWAVAKTIDHEPYDGGIIIVRPPFVGDPRMVVWNGNLYLGTNGNGVMNTNYAITPVLTLRSQNTAIVGAPTNPMIWEMENPSGQGRNNYECEIPSATVRMKDGSVKRFDELNVGDELVYGSVTNIMRGRSDLYRISSGSRELVCTGLHKVILADGREYAAEDFIETEDLELMTSGYDCPEYDLEGQDPYELGLTCIALPLEWNKWSLNQRLALLAGCLDRKHKDDGAWTLRTYIGDNQAEKFLAYSVGLSVINGSIYGDTSIIPTRKYKSYGSYPGYQYGEKEKFTIKKIEEGEFIGISVSNADQRYLKANGIVSHNCPAFSVVRDSSTGSNRLMFGFSVQLVDVNGRWNTIANQNYFNLLSSPQSSGTAASCVAFDVGKDCHPAGELITMFDGSLKRVEDIVAGDYVCGADGQPKRVTRPHRKTDDIIYEIAYNNGDTFKCSAGHLLKFGDEFIRADEASKKPRRWFWNKPTLRIGYDGKERPLGIEPYYYGLWLGDGSTIRPNHINNPDEEVKDWLRAYAKTLGLSFYEDGPDMIRNKMVTKDFNPRQSKQRLNPILNFFAENPNPDKNIPEWVFNLSWRQRMELLAGLIDTDGTLTTLRDKRPGRSDSQRFAHSQSRLDQIRGVKRLAQSVGLSVSAINRIRPHKVWYHAENRWIQSSLHYSIYIYGDLPLVPTKITRKQARLSSLLRSSIPSIKQCGRADVFGFECEGHLYRLANGIVTHNSYATALGSPDMMSPSTRGVVAFSAMNWGGAHYPGNSAYPQRFFNISKGLLRYESNADGQGGWHSMTFDSSKRVYIKRNGVVKTQLYAANQGSSIGRVDIDYNATVIDEFGWKTSGGNPYIANNLTHNVPYDKIRSIDWKQSGVALVLILRAVDGYHDSTCGFCFINFRSGDVLSVSQTG